MVGTEWPYYVFLAAASTQLAWQIFTVDLSSRADCNRKWVPEYTMPFQIYLLCRCSTWCVCLYISRAHTVV